MNKEDLEWLVDPDAPKAAEFLTATEAHSRARANSMIRTFFRDSRDDAVNLMFYSEQEGTEFVGVVTRQGFRRLGRTAGDSAPAIEPGSGDRITLPGASTRYKLLRFRCLRCSGEAHLIHHDTRNLPTCQEQHCQWEYQGEA